MDNLRILSLGRNLLKKIENVEVVAETLEELWLSYNQIEKLVRPRLCVFLACLRPSRQHQHSSASNSVRIIQGLEALGDCSCCMHVEIDSLLHRTTWLLWATSIRCWNSQATTKQTFLCPVLHTNRVGWRSWVSCVSCSCRTTRSRTGLRLIDWQQQSAWRTCCWLATPCTTTTRTTTLWQSTGLRWACISSPSGWHSSTASYTGCCCSLLNCEGPGLPFAAWIIAA